MTPLHKRMLCRLYTYFLLHWSTKQRRKRRRGGGGTVEVYGTFYTSCSYVTCYNILDSNQSHSGWFYCTCFRRFQYNFHSFSKSISSSRINAFISAFLCWHNSPPWARASFMRFLDHTQRRTTFGRTPPDEWSARFRDLYLTTLTIDIHAPGGIRTHNLSRRATLVLRLRLHGHWDRRFISKTWKICDYNYHVFEVPLFHLHWQGV